MGRFYVIEDRDCCILVDRRDNTHYPCANRRVVSRVARQIVQGLR